MYQKHTIYTLGTIETIQTGILEKLKQKQSTCSDMNQEPKLQKSPNNQLLHHNFSTSALTNTLSQWPICVGKSMFIFKPAKDKQEKVKEQRKEKQTILYRYFKRRIFGLSVILFLIHRLLYGFVIQTFFLIFQKTVEIYPQLYKTFDLKKIIDWQMEATQTLHLSKDTFYTAVAMAKKIYEKQRYQRFPHRVIEIQVASMLSLAGKMETNKINFVEAISAICGFQKEQIIEGQIFVLKALDFKIPSVFIEQKILQISSKWHNFILQNLSSLKMNQKKIKFGPSDNLQDWQIQGKKNLLHFSTLVDLLMLGFYQVIDYENLDQFIHLFLQALFMFVNYQNYELFPEKPSHKTYVVLIFQIFLKQKYQIQGDEFKKWMAELIKNNERLKLVEKTSHYFGINFHNICNQNSQSTTGKFMNLPTQDHEYLNQRYKKVILDS